MENEDDAREIVKLPERKVSKTGSKERVYDPRKKPRRQHYTWKELEEMTGMFSSSISHILANAGCPKDENGMYIVNDKMIALILSRKGQKGRRTTSNRGNTKRYSVRLHIPEQEGAVAVLMEYETAFWYFMVTKENFPLAFPGYTEDVYEYAYSRIRPGDTSIKVITLLNRYAMAGSEAAEE